MKNQKSPWDEWEERNLTAVNILARELEKLLRKAPDGSRIPDSVYDLREQIQKWG